MLMNPPNQPPNHGAIFRPLDRKAWTLQYQHFSPYEGLYRSLRPSGPHFPAQLPPHLRRRVMMEDEAWLQSISDFEDESYFARPLLQAREHIAFRAASSTQSASHANGVPSQWNASGGNMNSQGGFDNRSMNDHHINQQQGFGQTFTSNAALPQTERVQAAWPTGEAFHNPSSNLSVVSHDISPHIIPSHVSLADVFSLGHPNAYSIPLTMQSGITEPTPDLPYGLQSNLPASYGYNQCPASFIKDDNPSECHGRFESCRDANRVSQWCQEAASSVVPSQLAPPQSPSPTSGNSFSELSSTASRDQAQPRTDTTSHRLLTSTSRSAVKGSAPGINMDGVNELQAGQESRRRLPNAPTSFSSAIAHPSECPKDHLIEASEDDVSSSGSSAEWEPSSSHPQAKSASCLLRRLRSLSPSDSRSAKNEFLVQARMTGMSYKDIKAQGKFSEAESTLRGRFRTLTKNREARVRKPAWTATDVKLLRKGVHKMCKGQDFSTVKISWKQVATYIQENGGSYLFGNATCRKKWDELHRR